MAIEAVAALAAKEIGVQAAREAATQAAREIAQKMAIEPGMQRAGREIQTAMMERQAMQEGFRIGEMPESKGEGREVFKQMESDTAEELRSKLDAEEIRPQQESEAIHLPQSNGEWEGEPGNSEWRPDPDYVPQKNNPEGKTWGEIMEREEIDGIRYENGEPDFSEVAHDTVEIDDFSTDRNGNFAQADTKLAEKWNQEAKDGRTDWTPKDVEDYRRKNNLTWHERSDMKTMDLVPRDVHNNIPHSGGISVAKHLPESSIADKQTLLA